MSCWKGGGGGGGAPRIYGRRGVDRNTPRTYDRRADLWPAGLSQKGGQIRVRTEDRALKNRTVRPKAGRMAALSNAPFHILSNGNGVATREK